MAIVTGANKGIGLGMVKRLAELGVTVILTARDEGRGILAVHSLSSQGLHVHFSILDVSDPLSIQSFASWFQHTFGKLDILVSIYTIPYPLQLSLSILTMTTERVFSGSHSIRLREYCYRVFDGFGKIA